MSAISHPIAFMSMLAGSFGRARHYEHLFSLSDAQLNARGLNRDGLVRTYISSLGHN